MQAQQWSWAKDVGRWFVNGENTLVKTNAGGDLFATGTFFDNATLGDTTFYSDTSFYWNRGNYVARLDNANQLIWAEMIGGQNTTVYDLSVDNNNNTYVLGNFAYDLIFSDTAISDSGGAYLVYLVAFDANGVRKWVKLFPDMTNYGNYIINDGNNDLVYANASSNLNTIAVRKISTQNGNDIWTKTFSSTASIRGLKCNSQNEIYLNGGFGGDTLSIDNTIYYQDTGYYSSSFLAKLNTSGVLQDVEIVRGATMTDFGFDSQNNIYAIGSFEKKMKIRQNNFTTDICIVNNCTEFFMAKLNTSGTCSWARKMHDEGFWQGSIDIAQNGSFYYSGSFVDSVRFNSVVLTESEQRDALFIYKFDTDGIAQWAQKDEGGYLTDVFNFDLAYSESSCVYLCGNFHNYYATNWFGTDSLPYTGTHSHIFLAKLTDNGITTSFNDVKSKEVIFNVSPNPTEGIFSLNFKILPVNAKICVYDMFGHCVLNNIPLNQSNQIIDISSESKGVYIVEVMEENKKMVRKVAVQ